MRMRKGLTLYELNVWIILLGFFFLMAFRYSRTENSALQSIKDNNLSLYVLESARNQAALANEEGTVLTDQILKKTIEQFVLPIGFELGSRFLSDTTPESTTPESAEVNVPRKKSGVEFHIRIPRRPFRPSRVLSRSYNFR